MIQALRKLFSRKNQPTGSVLLTRRVADPMEDIPGFPEIYYCMKCGDYFVLAWLEGAHSNAESFQIVECHDHSHVFCPKCDESFPMYGFIPGSQLS